MTVAALYVQRGGVYWDLPGVDAWDEERDARKYAGPWPVVAHPPCERWGYFYAGSPLVIARTGTRKELGDDGGCFEAALAAVRRWGGVLEHPHGSQAWKRFGLSRPERWGAWTAADLIGGWTCCVDQGHFGHRASKATWLYANGINPPSLLWGRAVCEFVVTTSRGHWRPEIPKRERAATPLPFRDLLLSMARSVRPKTEAA